MIDEEQLKIDVTSDALKDVGIDLGIETNLDLIAIRTKILTFEVTFDPLRWESFNNFLNIDLNNWESVKYFDETGKKNAELTRIPNDKGGIYIYYIKPAGVPVNNYCCIMYVGRAHYGENTQNLRKRVYSYETESHNKYTGRVTIRQLFNRYRKYLYVMYCPVDGNDNIDKLEQELTAAIVPPVNGDLFQESLKAAKKMF